MSKNIKLFNKGKREIHGAGFVFKPQTAMEFNEETGTQLRKLYPSELLSLDDVAKQFEVAEASAEETAPAKKPAAKEKAGLFGGKKPAAKADENLTPPAPTDEELMAQLEAEQTAASA